MKPGKQMNELTAPVIRFSCVIIYFLGVTWNYSQLLILIGVRELKVRQIDHNIIFGW